MMKKTVLHVEDRGEASYYLRQFLQRKGYNVLTAIDTDDAEMVIEEYDKDIDYLIMDLHLPCLKEDAENVLQGWAWLVEYLFEKQSEFKNKTLIFSEYINILEDKHGKELKETYPNIRCIPRKSAEIDSFKEILETLKNMPHDVKNA